MSVNWSEIFRVGIKQLESDLEDSCQAFEEWSKSLADDYHERSPQYYYERAADLHRQKQYSPAIKQYTQAINLDAEYYQAYFR